MRNLKVCAKKNKITKISTMSEDYDAGGSRDVSKQSGQFHLPNATSRLRACLRCKIILSPQQFARAGCPNCDVDFIGDRQTVEELTTRNYSGTTAIIDPSRSWIGRNIKVSSMVPGVYAIAVQGYAPEDGRLDEYEAE